MREYVCEGDLKIFQWCSMQEIIAKTRTFRRFIQKEAISTATLHELIDLALLGGSARNSQPWQYMVVNTPELC
jgi:nitroreductase